MKALVIALLIVLLVSQSRIYSGENKGIYINFPTGDWCGVELIGEPGFFCNVE